LLARARPWDAPAIARAAVLERAADLLEARRQAFVGLIAKEGGKTLVDALSEVREAADYCRYYAARGRDMFSEPQRMSGPTGERNTLAWVARGVFACISPWNFPLAIFMGQVTAALAAGNGVIAKPAEQTPRIAADAVRILHEAGVPQDVLQLGIGEGGKLGRALVADPRIAGIAFTGSTETARAINQALAARPGPIVPLIAETGGINAMIVDSSALPEQVVSDVIASAFQSAGQRCSALRVLFVQSDSADRILAMLAGAMAELRLGDPADPATDVGPVIDAGARQALDSAAALLRARGRVIGEAPAPVGAGHFVRPLAVEVSFDDMPDREVFGPVLPVIRYDADDLDRVIAAVSGTGYGLTMGIHSRIDRFARTIMERAKVGNIYVNRSMIGAIVGVQPFGGQGLSGTGPKAGGPHYLTRFAVETTVSVNTAAIGGDVHLVALTATRT
jgi:RHH-type proline utilization regulon transcriptional repressor/proline dehydrogenase/delta 1-pyrroline-5-carboxylate dehydrogenase